MELAEWRPKILSVAGAWSHDDVVGESGVALVASSRPELPGRRREGSHRKLLCSEILGSAWTAAALRMTPQLKAEEG